jgi:hypothetical protein
MELVLADFLGEPVKEGETEKGKKEREKGTIKRSFLTSIFFVSPCSWRSLIEVSIRALPITKTSAIISPLPPFTPTDRKRKKKEILLEGSFVIPSPRKSCVKGKATHISFSINSNLPPTVLFASAVSCFNRTGPTSL